MEQRLKALERTSNGITFYWSSDIPELIKGEEGTPSLSSFRRRAQEGKIRTVEVGGRETAYHSEDVKRFLRGELSLQRGGARTRKRAKQAGAPAPATGYEQLAIDTAKESDLLHLYLLESEQLDYI